MKIKNKHLILYSAIFIIVLATILLFSKLFSISQGFTIASISLANPPVKGQPNEWVINAYVNGWGQSIIGNLDANEIKYQGVIAEYPLQISGYVSENKGFYLIDASRFDYIYQYRVVTKYGSVKDYVVYKKVEPAPLCEGSPAFTWSYPLPSTVLGIPLNDRQDAVRLCIYKDVVGQVTDVLSSLPNIRPKIHIDVSAKGQTTGIDLDSYSVAVLPNGMGSIMWTNNPVQANNLGVLSIGNKYRAVSSSGSSWKPIYSSDYSGSEYSYLTLAKGLENELNSYKQIQPEYLNWENIGCKGYSYNQLKEASICLKNYWENKVNIVNSKANSILSSTVSIENKYTTYSVSNRQPGFWVDFSNIYTSAPNIQIRIKSEWIGIKYPNGKPKVLSVETYPKEVQSGQPLTVKVLVSNIGSGTGNFVLQNFRCGSLTQTANVYPITIQPGKQEYIQFTMTTQFSSDETGKCTVDIYDTGSLEKDTFSFDYKITKPTFCEEGKLYWFGGNFIKICKNNKLEDLIECEYGVTTDSKGNWICASKPSDNDDITSTSKCSWNPTDWGICISQFFKAVRNIIIVLAIILFVVFILWSIVKIKAFVNLAKVAFK